MADGQQAYKCILTVYNEHGLLLGQYVTHTPSIMEVKEALLLIAARYAEGDGPAVCARGASCHLCFRPTVTVNPIPHHIV